MARRLREDLRASVAEKDLGTDHERVGAPLQKAGKGRINLVAVAGSQHVDLPPNDRRCRLHLLDRTIPCSGSHSD